MFTVMIISKTHCTAKLKTKQTNNKKSDAEIMQKIKILRYGVACRPEF